MAKSKNTPTTNTHEKLVSAFRKLIATTFERTTPVIRSNSKNTDRKHKSTLAISVKSFGPLLASDIDDGYNLRSERALPRGLYSLMVAHGYPKPTFEQMIGLINEAGSEVLRYKIGTPQERLTLFPAGVSSKTGSAPKVPANKEVLDRVLANFLK